MAADLEAQEALAHRRAYGWDAVTDVGHAFGYVVAPDATASKYANDHGRFDVRDRMIPLTLYHPPALDPMWEHLTAGTPLPESQVVHTTPRGGEPGHAPDLAQANVKLIPLHPRSEDPIRVRAGRVTVPD